MWQSIFKGSTILCSIVQYFCNTLAKTISKTYNIMHIIGAKHFLVVSEAMHQLFQWTVNACSCTKDKLRHCDVWGRSFLEIHFRSSIGTISCKSRASLSTICYPLTAFQNHMLLCVSFEKVYSKWKILSLTFWPTYKLSSCDCTPRNSAAIWINDYLTPSFKLMGNFCYLTLHLRRLA